MPKFAPGKRIRLLNFVQATCQEMLSLPQEWAGKNMVEKSILKSAFEKAADCEGVYWDYTACRCLEVSDIVVMKLEEMGINARKALAVGKFFGLAALKAEDAFRMRVLFDNHLTACVSVNAGDRYRLYAIDPTLFDGPVLLDDWAHAQKAGRVFIMPANIDVIRGRVYGPYTDTELNENRNDALNYLMNNALHEADIRGPRFQRFPGCF